MSASWSVLEATAIDREDLSSDPAGLLARQKQGRVGDVFGRPEPAGIEACEHSRLSLGAIALPLLASRRVREDQARRDRVRCDPMLRKADGKLLREADYRVFGGGVGV